MNRVCGPDRRRNVENVASVPDAFHIEGSIQPVIPPFPSKNIFGFHFLSAIHPRKNRPFRPTPHLTAAPDNFHPLPFRQTRKLHSVHYGIFRNEPSNLPVIPHIPPKIIPPYPPIPSVSHSLHSAPPEAEGQGGEAPFSKCVHQQNSRAAQNATICLYVRALGAFRGSPIAPTFPL